MARVTTGATRRVAMETGDLEAKIDIIDARTNAVLMSSRDRPGAVKIEIIEGQVTTDDTREIPGEVNFRVLVTEANADELIPLRMGHPLSPVSRSKVQLNFGPPGQSTEDETRYGRYDISEVSLAETPEGVLLDVQAYDIARRIKLAQFPRAFLVLKGTPYEQGIINLLIGVIPEEDVNFTPTGRKSQAIWVYSTQDDRLAAIEHVATATGYRIVYNEGGIGGFGYHPDTAIDAEPVWNFEEGDSQDSRIISASITISDEKSYNGVIVEGDAVASDKAPAHGEAWDTNPNSPNQYDPNNPDASIRGPVPFFYVSRLVATNQQAKDAAVARLRKVTRMTERFSFTCLPNVGIDIGDPINANRERIGARGTFIVESVALPFKASAGRMTVTCRERRVLA